MAGHFSEFGLLPEICQGIEDMEWLLPTDVQAEAIPLILGGGDVLMAAETGSGKTGAFSLPVIQIVHETIRDINQGKIAGGGSAVTASKWAMNILDRSDQFAISGNGLLCQSREQRAWQGCRSNLAVTKGKYYYEATVTDEGLCRVGWSTKQASYDLGTDAFGFGFGGTGKKSFARQFDTYGEPFGINDTIGCYIDLDQGVVKFSKNGVDFGNAFDIPEEILGNPFHAAVVLKNAELKFTFGDPVFKFPPKGGFVGLTQAPSNDVTSGSTPPTNKKFSNICAPSALIMEPSRELAKQTHDNITMFKKYLPHPLIRETLLIGGENSRNQIQEIQKGVDIVTGTPGKLDDFVSTGKLKLHNVRFFILDEADGLLSQGYQEMILRFYNQIPKTQLDGKKLQVTGYPIGVFQHCAINMNSITTSHLFTGFHDDCMLSYSSLFDVKRLAEKIMSFPTWVDLKGQDSVPETVHHVMIHTDPWADTSWTNYRSKIKTDGIHAKDKINPQNQSPEMASEAVKILKTLYLVKAIDEHNMDQAIVFCRTKIDCDNVENYLLTLGGGAKAMVNKYSCVCLHSDRSPSERTQNLQKFKDGEVRFLICTDVAARGIDISGVPFVVNVTFSDDKQNYIHRIGRVGRADRMGLAISFISSVKEKVWYHGCPSKGKNCSNTQLKERGGCAIWYDELQYLADAEGHLGETIPVCQPDMKVPVNEFDGKVAYGEKKSKKGSGYLDHTAELAPAVQELAQLEYQVQTSFLNFRNRDWTKVN